MDVDPLLGVDRVEGSRFTIASVISSVCVRKDLPIDWGAGREGPEPSGSATDSTESGREESLRLGAGGEARGRSTSILSDQ